MPAQGAGGAAAEALGEGVATISKAPRGRANPKRSAHQFQSRVSGTASGIRPGSSSSDGVVQLTPPVIFSLEQCLDFIEKDELLEVTPKALRLRKKELEPNKRKRRNLNVRT